MHSADILAFCGSPDFIFAWPDFWDPGWRWGILWSLSCGTYFTYWDDLNKKATALSSALDLFRYRTESKYISRLRFEELATKFKDGLFGAYLEDEEYKEFFADECEMEDYEKEFFGIESEEE